MNFLTKCFLVFSASHSTYLPIVLDEENIDEAPNSLFFLVPQMSHKKNLLLYTGQYNPLLPNQPGALFSWLK